MRLIHNEDCTLHVIIFEDNSGDLWHITVNGAERVYEEWMIEGYYNEENGYYIS